MGMTLLSGPVVSSGPLIANSASLMPSINAGPSVFYQGTQLPDVRQGALNKDNMNPGTIKGHQELSYLQTCDVVPSALANNNIAAAQFPTNGTPLTLAAASAGIATGIPFFQFNTSTLVTANVALDFGFQSCNCTANSQNITVTDSTQFFVGMPLVIANVGNAGGTSALLTYVTGITSATVITVANAPLATNSATPCGLGNAWGALYNGPVLVPTAAYPYLAVGDDLLLSPYEGIARGVRIVGTSLTAGGAVTISGYDFYGQPQTETLTLASGTSTQWSQKTYRFIQSVIPAFTDGSHNISVGTSDLFGFAIRNDKWEYDNIFWAGALLTASTGWTKADTTSPATATTKDVRGTIQIGTNGPGGSGATGGATNGTLRLAISHLAPLYNLSQGTPGNPVPMYGVTPV